MEYSFPNEQKQYISSQQCPEKGIIMTINNSFFFYPASW